MCSREIIDRSAFVETQVVEMTIKPAHFFIVVSLCQAAISYLRTCDRSGVSGPLSRPTRSKSLQHMEDAYVSVESHIDITRLRHVADVDFGVEIHPQSAASSLGRRPSCWDIPLRTAEDRAAGPAGPVPVGSTSGLSCVLANIRTHYLGSLCSLQIKWSYIVP